MLTSTADEWWSTGVGYCLDVKRFTDSDGDGRGDLAGLGAHLDHLVDLGVSFLWLQPFYASPEGDDGYDISDYYATDDGVGTLGEFVEVVRSARERGIRTIVDLVVNHTSDEHPWFRSARADPGSPYRDWYVWRQEPDPADADADIIFPDAESSVWTKDDVAGLYFRHRFYRSQPDLNTSHPEVRDEIRRIMGFWLQLGVSGFRVDAAPFLAETAMRSDDADDADDAAGQHVGDRDEQHDDDSALDESLAMLDVMRTFLSRRSAEAVMLGEVNKPRHEIAPFFGGSGQRMTMCFDFTLNQALYLAMARGDATPVREAVGSRPELPEGKSWGLFVRNHDELTLDQLSDGERQEVFDAFGPEEDVQVFGRGLRLRLPTMVDGDRDRMELAYSLTWSLPGTPVLYYGEEVRLSEDLSIPGRMAVRTPMPWTRDDAGSADGPCVADAERDPGSLLHWFRRMLRAYRGRPELGRGELRFVDVANPAVLAHTMTWRGRTVLAVHSLTGEPQTVTVPADVVAPGTELVELVTSEPSTVPEGGLVLDLPRYAHLWLGRTG